MESETVLCSADFHCDDPFLRRGRKYFQTLPFYPYPGSLFTYIEKYCKICLDNNKIRNKYTLQALRHAGLSYMLAGGAPKDAVANYAGITGRWMTRYDRIITSKTYNQAVNYSIITIQ